jgi:hypothetical protein
MSEHKKFSLSVKEQEKLLPHWSKLWGHERKKINIIAKDFSAFVALGRTQRAMCFYGAVPVRGECDGGSWLDLLSITPRT